MLKFLVGGHITAFIDHGPLLDKIYPTEAEKHAFFVKIGKIRPVLPREGIGKRPAPDLSTSSPP